MPERKSGGEGYLFHSANYVQVNERGTAECIVAVHYVMVWTLVHCHLCAFGKDDEFGIVTSRQVKIYFFLAAVPSQKIIDSNNVL